MIELRNISKTYKSKKGVSTQALKNINIKFNDTGITFILGKSGSGKSTLLNILGGLDKYTSGDLIINGKSSKKFKSKDWDAYRNTYMGFVFQEFNLIDNYSVYQNIKLSLELQNRKVKKEEVQEVLNKVGLDELLKRKPNELSGGQKQRVAIARTLIKKPEIILADEPTGNLDSETSKQIFELLKKLSKDKLIVIVSHDEESAKKYADRIIRIQDGIIESDTAENLENNKREFNLINARLPFKYSLKMGLGNLFHKKIKLIFTIILVTLCLTCLGIMFSATSFDINEEHINTLLKNNSYEISVNSYEKYQDYAELLKKSITDSESAYTEYFTSKKTKELDDEVVKEAEEKTGLIWHKENTIYQNSTAAYIKFVGENSNEILYYSSMISPTFIELNDDEKLDNLIGRLPENGDEIVITSYIADNIIKSGVYFKNENNKSDSYKPGSYQQIINDHKYIQIENLNNPVKIVGIINYDMSKYDKFKNITYDEFLESLDYDVDYDEFSSNDSYKRIYVNKQFIDNQKLKDNNVLNDATKIYYNNKTFIIDKAQYLIDNIEYYNGSSIVKNMDINDEEVIIDLNVLNDITNNDYQKQLENYVNTNYYIEEYSIKDFSINYIKKNNIIGTKIKSSITPEKIVKSIDNYKEYVVKGIVLNDSLVNQIYLSKNNLVKNLPLKVSSTKMFTTATTKEEMETVFKYYPIDKSYIVSSTKYSDSLMECTVYIYMIQLVGKYGSIFFLILSLFLIVNFISNSISFRKKEIGILRSLGCKGKDVLKIFITEMVILISICLFISNIIINKIVLLFNTTISDFINKDISFLVYGYPQFIYLIIVILAIVLAASTIPILKITKAKPIDSIINK